MKTKFCSKCKQKLNKENSYIYGGGKIYSYCFDCARKQWKLWRENNKDKKKKWESLNKDKIKKYNRKQYENNKEDRYKKSKITKKSKFEFIRNIKEQRGECEICGYNKNPYILHFHHKNPKDKTFKISDSMSKVSSFEKIKEEIDKCRLICPNCHSEIHAKEYLGKWMSK